MHIIDNSLFSQPTKENLYAFLTLAQQTAQKKQHWQLASISLRTKHLDPLAVLESIYESTQRHFYLEHPANDEALAGTEAILEYTSSGVDRFQSAKKFAQEVLQNTIAVGDLHLPFTGPHFFCGFTFFDNAEEPTPPFYPCTLFVPRWQVAYKQGVYTSVANALVTEGTDLRALADKIWQAHGKFSLFDYTTLQEKSAGNSKKRHIEEVTQKDWYPTAVEAAVNNIKAGKYEKIVLARAVDLQHELPLQPLQKLHQLREHFPTCYTFSLANTEGQSFIGATPEKILCVHNQTLFTEALAGTAPRGKNVQHDATLAANLLKSTKDLHEQRLILDQIVAQLETLGIATEISGEPRLLKLKNVQHLLTPITGKLPTERHCLEILQLLHPTPAVGGLPREAALKDIAALEQFPRGLYAGSIGYFDHKGDCTFTVGIRSALIDQAKARLYAGAGIIAQSNPQSEKEETDLKLNALLEVF